MQKVNIKNSRSLNLVGQLNEVLKEAIVVMCHGFTGDRHEFGKFDKVSQEINEKGISTFAFDFSGSGESDDDTLLVAKQVDDLNCVVDYLLNLEYKTIGFFAHSLGGLVCLNWYNQNLKKSSFIKSMVLWAPVTHKNRYEWDQRYSKDELKQAKELGYIIKHDDKRVRKVIKIDAKILKEREEVNQKELVEKVQCPVHIIHGTKDERVPLLDSQQSLELNSNFYLTKIEGADHGFNGFVDEVSKQTAAIFQEF